MKVLLGIWTLSLAVLAPAASRSEAAESNSPVKDISSPVRENRERAASRVLSDRSTTIKTLIQLAGAKEEKPQWRGPKDLAVELLGEYRATEAIDLLVKDVSYRVPAISPADDSLVGYTCAKALIEIGSPSVQAIVRCLQQPAKEKELMLFAHVIRRIDGEDVGLFRLEAALKETPLGAKKNIESLIEIYKAKRTDF